MHRDLLYLWWVSVFKSFEHMLERSDLFVVWPRLVEGLSPFVQVNICVDTSECCKNCSNLYLFYTAMASFLHPACKYCCNPCFGLEIDFLQVWVNYEGFAIGPPELPKLFLICQSRFHSPIRDAFVTNSKITFLLNANERRKPCQGCHQAH